MSLTIAARRLDQTVLSADRLRLRYTEKQFPEPELVDSGRLGAWVLSKLSRQEIVLVNEVSLEIGGQWSNYLFPRPEQTSDNDN
jgi:hypothetical protein